MERSRDPNITADEAEEFARTALSLQYSAFNWLEDSEFEDEAHGELHEYGRQVRERFPDGCAMTWTGDAYEIRCPVVLCHKRFGFSPGFVVASRICTLCGLDASECDHSHSHWYEVSGGPGPAGICPVCHKEDCDDDPQQTYVVRAGTLIKKIIRMDELSLVHRPRQPDARLAALPVSRAELEDALGPEFVYGVHAVFCHKCLSPCPGLDRLPGDPRLDAP